MLPSIKISLPVIFVLWCVGGVWAMGPKILAYPALWAAVAAVFLLVDFLLGKPTPIEAPAASAPPNDTAG